MERPHAPLYQHALVECMNRVLQFFSLLVFVVGAAIISIASALLPPGFTYYVHSQPMLSMPNVMLGLAMMVRGGENNAHMNPADRKDRAAPAPSHQQPMPSTFQFNVGTLREGPDAIRTMSATNQIITEFASCPAATAEAGMAANMIGELVGGI